MKTESMFEHQIKNIIASYRFRPYCKCNLRKHARVVLWLYSENEPDSLTTLDSVLAVVDPSSEEEVMEMDISIINRQAETVVCVCVCVSVCVCTCVCTCTCTCVCVCVCE